MNSYFPEDRVQLPEPGNVLLVEGELVDGGYLTKEIDVQRDYFITPEEGYCPDYAHKVKVLSGEIYCDDKLKNKLDKINIVTLYDNVKAIHVRFVADIYGKTKLRKSTAATGDGSSPSKSPSKPAVQEVKQVVDLTVLELVEIVQGMFEKKNLSIDFNFNFINNRVELVIPGGVEIFLLHHLLWDYMGFPSENMLAMTEKIHGDNFSIKQRALAKGYRNGDMAVKRITGETIDPYVKLKNVSTLYQRYKQTADVNVFLYEFNLYVRFINNLSNMKVVVENLHLEKSMFIEDLQVVLTKYFNLRSPFTGTPQSKIKVVDKEGLVYIMVDNNYYKSKKVVHFLFGDKIVQMLNLKKSQQFSIIDRVERLNSLSIDLINEKFFPLHVMLDNTLCIDQTSTVVGGKSPAHTNLLGIFINSKKFVPAQKTFLLPSTLFNTLVLRIATTNEEYNRLPYRMYARFYFQTTNVALRKRSVLPSLY